MRRYLQMTAAQMALLTGLAILTIGACLPIWTIWHVNEWEGVGIQHGFVWQAVAEIPANSHFCHLSELLTLHERNLLTAAVFYLLAWIAGLAVFLIARRKGK